MPRIFIMRGILLRQSFTDFLPVDYLEEVVYVFRSLIIVLQVISVFPYVYDENRT